MSAFQAVGGHYATAREAVARVANEPNGFWKSLAIGLAAVVVAMLGWFLIDQTTTNRDFRQEARGYWSDVEQRLYQIETRLERVENNDRR